MSSKFRIWLYIEEQPDDDTEPFDHGEPDYINLDFPTLEDAQEVTAHILAKYPDFWRITS